MRNFPRASYRRPTAAQAVLPETMEEKIAVYARTYARLWDAQQQKKPEAIQEMLINQLRHLGPQIDLSNPETMKAVMDATCVPGGGRAVRQDDNEESWQSFIGSFLQGVFDEKNLTEAERGSSFLRPFIHPETLAFATFFLHLSGDQSDASEKFAQAKAGIYQALPPVPLTPNLWQGLRGLSEGRHIYYQILEGDPKADLPSVAEEVVDHLFHEISEKLTPEIIERLTDKEHGFLYSLLQGASYTKGHRTELYERNLTNYHLKLGNPPAFVRHRKQQVQVLEKRLQDHLPSHLARLSQAKRDWLDLSSDQKGDVLSGFIDLAAEVLALPNKPSLSFYTPTLPPKDHKDSLPSKKYPVTQTEDAFQHAGGYYRANQFGPDGKSPLWHNQVSLALAWVDDFTESEKPYFFRSHVTNLLHETLHADDTQQLFLREKSLSHGQDFLAQLQGAMPSIPENDPLADAYKMLGLGVKASGRNAYYNFGDPLYPHQPTESFVRFIAPYWGSTINGLLVHEQINREGRRLPEELKQLFDETALAVADHQKRAINRWGYSSPLIFTLPSYEDIAGVDPAQIVAPPLASIGMQPFSLSRMTSQNRAGIAELKDRLFFLTKQPKMDDRRMMPFYLDIVPSLLQLSNWMRSVEKMFGYTGEPVPPNVLRLELSARQLAFDLVDFAYMAQTPAQRHRFALKNQKPVVGS